MSQSDGSSEPPGQASGHSKSRPVRTRVEAVHVIAQALDGHALMVQRRRSAVARDNLALVVYLDRQAGHMSRIMARTRRRLRQMNGLEAADEGQSE